MIQAIFRSHAFFTKMFMCLRRDITIQCLMTFTALNDLYSAHATSWGPILPRSAVRSPGVGKV